MTDCVWNPTCDKESVPNCRFCAQANYVVKEHFAALASRIAEASAEVTDVADPLADFAARLRTLSERLESILAGEEEERKPGSVLPTAPGPVEATEGEHEMPADATPGERFLLHELKQVKGYPFDIGRDLEHIRSLVVDFPSLDLLSEVKSWRAYKLDKPLDKKHNPRLQFRNWCRIAVERQKRVGRTPQAPSQDWVPQTHKHTAQEMAEAERMRQQVQEAVVRLAESKAVK